MIPAQGRLDVGLGAPVQEIGEHALPQPSRLTRLRIGQPSPDVAVPLREQIADVVRVVDEYHDVELESRAYEAADGFDLIAGFEPVHGDDLNLPGRADRPSDPIPEPDLARPRRRVPG